MTGLIICDTRAIVYLNLKQKSFPCVKKLLKTSLLKFGKR